MSWTRVALDVSLWSAAVKFGEHVFAEEYPSTHDSIMDAYKNDCFQEELGLKEGEDFKGPIVMGFVDEFGRFMTREEAAKKLGIVDKEGSDYITEPQLYAEDLAEIQHPEDK